MNGFGGEFNSGKMAQKQFNTENHVQFSEKNTKVEPPRIVESVVVGNQEIETVLLQKMQNKIAKSESLGFAQTLSPKYKVAETPDNIQQKQENQESKMANKMSKKVKIAIYSILGLVVILILIFVSALSEMGGVGR